MIFFLDPARRQRFSFFTNPTLHYPTPAEPDQLLPVATNDGTPLGIGVNPAIIEAEV